MADDTDRWWLLADGEVLRAHLGGFVWWTDRTDADGHLQTYGSFEYPPDPVGAKRVTPEEGQTAVDNLIIARTPVYLTRRQRDFIAQAMDLYADTSASDAGLAESVLAAVAVPETRNNKGN